MKLTETNGLVVHLTPTVRDSRQLLLHESREQRFFASPGVSSHVLTRTDEQYRVYEQGENGEYQKRGILPFREVREYTDDPDTLDKQLFKPYIEEHHAIYEESWQINPWSARWDEIGARMHEIALIGLTLKPEPVRSALVMPDAPYATATFNLGAPSPAYKTKVVREVFAPLPSQFSNLPPMHTSE